MPRPDVLKEIKAAEKRADEIIAEAESDREDRIAQARTEADEIRAAAQAEAEERAEQRLSQLPYTRSGKHLFA